VRRAGKHGLRAIRGTRELGRDRLRGHRQRRQAMRHSRVITAAVGAALAVWAAGSAHAGSADGPGTPAETIDACAYPDAAAARKAWQPMRGSAEVDGARRRSNRRRWPAGGASRCRAPLPARASSGPRGTAPGRSTWPTDRAYVSRCLCATRRRSGTSRCTSTAATGGTRRVSRRRPAGSIVSASPPGAARTRTRCCTWRTWRRLAGRRPSWWSGRSRASRPAPMTGSPATPGRRRRCSRQRACGLPSSATWT